MKNEVIDDKTLAKYVAFRDMWLRLINSAKSQYDLFIVMEAIKSTRNHWYSLSKSDGSLEDIVNRYTDLSKNDFERLCKLADEFILISEGILDSKK